MSVLCLKTCLFKDYELNERGENFLHERNLSNRQCFFYNVVMRYKVIFKRFFYNERQLSGIFLHFFTVFLAIKLFYI